MSQAPERGWNSSVSVNGGVIHKVSNELYPLSVAEGHLEALWEYYQSLRESPLPVAPLLDAGIVADGDAYRVWHDCELLDGPSLLRSPRDEQRLAISGLLRQIAQMQTGNGYEIDPPIDAHGRNLVVVDGEARLVDLWKPLARVDGKFPRHLFSTQHGHIEWLMGTVPGVIIGLLHSVIGNSDGSALAGLLRVALSDAAWCYDVLPPELDPSVRRIVEKELRARFAPYIGRTVASAVSGRAYWAARRARQALQKAS